MPAPFAPDLLSIGGLTLADVVNAVLFAAFSVAAVVWLWRGLTVRPRDREPTDRPGRPPYPGHES